MIPPCERCDHAECDVPAARANLEAFKNGHHAEPGYAEAIARNRKAHDDCAARPAVNQRDVALALRARIGEVERERDDARQSARNAAAEFDVMRGGIHALKARLSERDARLAAIAAVVEPVAEAWEKATPGTFAVERGSDWRADLPRDVTIRGACVGIPNATAEIARMSGVGEQVDARADLVCAAVNLVPTLRGMVKGDSNE